MDFSSSFAVIRLITFFTKTTHRNLHHAGLQQCRCVESASEFLSVFPSVLHSVFSCSPARNACQSHPSYIYHPLDICPLAGCKYSIMQYKMRTSLLHFRNIRGLLQPVTQEIPCFLMNLKVQYRINKSSPRLCPEPNVSV